MKTYLLTVRSSTLLRVLFLLAILLFITKIVSAQNVKEEWVRHYGDSVEVFVDFSVSTTKVDNDGNTFTAGVVNDRTPDASIVIAKFSPTGEQLWITPGIGGGFYEAIALSEITLDANGDLYVIGSIDAIHDARGELVVAKFNGFTGKREWISTLNPYTGDRGLHVAVDNKGAVFTVGRSSGVTIHYLSKFNAATGELIWSEDVLITTGPSTTPRLVDITHIAIDNEGEVYLTGRTRTTVDIFTFKYRSSDGERLWESSYATDQSDRATGLAIDNAGGVYVSGVSQGTPAAEFILKYNSEDGAEVWKKAVGQEGNNLTALSNLLSDNTGGVFISGELNNESHIARVNPTSGDVDWLVAFADTIVELGSDNAGNLYAAGAMNGTDYVIRKYDALTGEPGWENIRTGDRVLNLEVQENGDPFVTGISSLNSKIFVARQGAADGNQVSEFFFLSDNYLAGYDHTDDSPSIMEPDAEGNIYLTGTASTESGSDDDYSFIVKYSPEGDQLWSLKIQTRRVYDMTLDAAGDVYLMSYRRGGDGRDDLLVTKYNKQDGTALWSHAIAGGYNFGYEIKTDNIGGVFVSGYRVHPATPGATQYYLYKLNATDGTQLWAESFSILTSPSTAELSNIREFEIDATGDVYVVGSSRTASATEDVAILKLSGETGTRLWTQHYDSGDSDGPFALEISNNNELFVTGLSIPEQGGATTFLVKYNALTGAQTGFTAQGGFHMSIDNAGGIYVQSGRSIFKFITTDLFLVWETQLEFGPSNFDVDAAGNVYTTHEVDADIITTKYAAADGAKVWEVTTDANTSGSLLTLDHAANVFVAGIIRKEFHNDVIIVKYSQEDDCNVPVHVTLTLPPKGAKVNKQVLSTADFGDFILEEDTGVRWNWGDGSEPSESFTELGTSRIAGEHRYTQAGIYRVGLNYDESCLRPLNDDYEEWLAIYDPSAGFVTGGGWYNSPVSDYELMKAKERVEFAFTIHYRNKRADTPQGNLVLHLGKRQLFMSRELDWLVIRDDRAVFRGEGTVQGRGRYGFLVSVLDAGGHGVNDREDQIRVRIWNLEDGNNIEYDNFDEAGDIYDMNTALQNIGRGQIIIHHRNQVAKNMISSNQTDALKPQLYNYPNKFTDRTTISFTTSQKENYVLEVYDLRGKLVKRLGAGTAQKGQEYNFELDGAALPKGLYVARLVSDTGTQTIKMILER